MRCESAPVVKSADTNSSVQRRTEVRAPFRVQSESTRQGLDRVPARRLSPALLKVSHKPDAQARRIRKLGLGKPGQPAESADHSAKL
jgi:hypothetical protein